MYCTRLFSALLIALMLTATACAQTRASALPDSYRDFTITARSTPTPDSDNTFALLMTATNRGAKPLDVRIRLGADDVVGLKPFNVAFKLAPAAEQEIAVSFKPQEGLVQRIIEGEIHFGNVPARDLFITVRGTDPPDWKPYYKPDVDDPSETLLITDRAQVVACYAPRKRIDWWQSHPSSSVTGDRRVKPLVTLAKAGQTGYVVHANLQKEDADALAAALSDLTRCIGIISGGAKMQVVAERKSDQPAIVLNLAKDGDWPHPDAYHLHTTARGDVVIDAGHVDGLRNGIYGLLTDHLDCHWFIPGDVGEEVPRPKDQAAVIGQIDQKRSPAFYSAAGSTWGHQTWNVRNRGVARGGKLTFGHAWTHYVRGTPELYEKHPEWFARDREGNIRKFDTSTGWSSTNFCSTNPDVLEMVAEKVNARLSQPGAIVASLDPNDYAQFCLCETCTAVDKQYGADNPDGTYSTDRVIHFCNEIASRLTPENQGKLLGFLVYAYQIQLPASAKPKDNVVGMICNMDWSYDHTRPLSDPTSPSNRKFLRLVRGWGKLLTQMGFYDYPTDYRHYAPYGQVMKLREDIPLVKELGVTFMMIEGQPILSTSALNLYVCSRLQYDVNEDADVLMEEFFEKYHGPAAEPMRKYWLGMEYYTATQRPGPKAYEHVTRTPEMWTQLDGYLKEAEAIVAKLPESEKRFRDRVAYHRRGFELGRRKCAIRDAVYTNYGEVLPNVNTVDINKAITEYRQWIADTRKLHAESEGYFPPLIPNYYYGSLDRFLNQAAQKLEASSNPDE